MAVNAPKTTAPTVRPTTTAQPASHDAELAKMRDMLKNGPFGIYKKIDDFLKQHPTLEQIVNHSKSFPRGI